MLDLAGTTSRQSVRFSSTLVILGAIAIVVDHLCIDNNELLCTEALQSLAHVA